MQNLFVLRFCWASPAREGVREAVLVPMTGRWQTSPAREGVHATVLVPMTGRAADESGKVRRVCSSARADVRSAVGVATSILFRSKASPKQKQTKTNNKH